jgi:elongation factor Ts
MPKNQKRQSRPQNLIKTKNKGNLGGEDMADISIEEIKRLRELTGVGITDAKAALVESKGNFDTALAAMRKKGLTKAEKRGEREARAGIIGTYNHDGRIGVLVEVNCETDFVARNDLFTTLVKDVAMHIAASNPEFVSKESVPKDIHDTKLSEFMEKAKTEGKPDNMLESIAGGMTHKYFAERVLLEQPFVKNPDITVGDYVKENIAKLGENIVVRRFDRMALGEITG